MIKIEKNIPIPESAGAPLRESSWSGKIREFLRLADIGDSILFEDCRPESIAVIANREGGKGWYAFRKLSPRSARIWRIK